MIEQMITEAVLRDSFSGPLRRMASEQDAYARKTNSLNTAGNVLIGAGAALTGLAVKSVKVAAAYDQQRQAFGALLGNVDKGKAMFDDLAKFTVKTPFQLQDWTQATRTLMGWGMAAKDVMPALEGLGNSEASMGRTGADLQKASYELGEMNAGFISMRQVRNLMMDGVPAATMLKKELHLTGEELANIGKQHIDGKIGVAAILKGIKESNLAGGMATQMNTLPGSITSLKDNWNLFLDQMGEPALRPLTNLVNEASDFVSKIRDMSDGTKKFVTLLAYGAGPTMLVGGGVLKAVAAYRTYTSILKLAAAAGAIERAGEKEKVGIAAAEGEAVAGSAAKYAGLRGWLLKTGEASLGARAATTGLTGTLAAGAGTIGLYAVALAGLVTVGYEVVSMFTDMNQASRDFEASTAAVAKARADGYDLKNNAGQAQGFNALPVWKQVLSGFGHSGLWGAVANPWGALYGSTLADGSESGTSALTDAHSRALAKQHGMAKNGVRAQQIAAQQAQAAAAAAAKAASADAAGQAANDYKLDPALDFKLKEDERRVALLKAMGGHEKELKAARAAEIADLGTAAGLLERQASLATDVTKKYDLLNDAAEDRQKAKMLGLAGKDDRDKLDKTVAQIIGGGGLSEDEILKRAGIGRGFFAGMSKGHVPGNPLKAALDKMAKRPLIINLRIGDKPFGQIKDEIVDDALHQVVQALSGSGQNLLFQK